MSVILSIHIFVQINNLLMICVFYFEECDKNLQTFVKKISICKKKSLKKGYTYTYVFVNCTKYVKRIFILVFISVFITRAV